MIYAPGSVSQSVTVRIEDDGRLAVTGLVAATFPAVTYKKAGAIAAVAISLSDLALITTAWASGGVKEISGGYYRLDLPDAAFSTTANVTLIGDASGKHLVCPALEVKYVQVDARQWLGAPIATPDTAGYPKVTHKSGTGTGELDLSNGRVQSDVAYWASNPLVTADVPGAPTVSVKYFADENTGNVYKMRLAGDTSERFTFVDTDNSITVSFPTKQDVDAVGGASDADIAAIASATATALAGTINVTVNSPATGGTLDVFRGDSYATADGRGLTITKATGETWWPTTLSTVHFYCGPTDRTLVDAPSAASIGPTACTVNTASGSSQAFTLQLTSTQLATLTAGGAGGYVFWCIANKDTAPATLRSGSMTVRADPTA
jgi:hypothetical protein